MGYDIRKDMKKNKEDMAKEMVDKMSEEGVFDTAIAYFVNDLRDEEVREWYLKTYGKEMLV